MKQVRQNRSVKIIAAVPETVLEQPSIIQNLHIVEETLMHPQPSVFYILLHSTIMLDLILFLSNLKKIYMKVFFGYN